MLPLGRKLNKEDEKDENVLDGQDAWTTIDKTVRNVDEDKIKDCTDDIDTLLVFPDTKEDLLRQIAGQSANYSFSGGYLNSTFSPSQLPPFQAALSDIRVNVCWFASLVLSLSTASYGILVKQWLREYLAIDRTSPQERIRIRHFRARGLDEWRLFDIAAILPVILQISLTLFFVGLCFFTAAVHPSIGRTSICLVGGWAVVFLFAVLAPLLSARCPYKTTFLKSAFIHLRPYVRSMLSHGRSLVLLPRNARTFGGRMLSQLGNTGYRLPVLDRVLHIIHTYTSSIVSSVTQKTASWFQYVMSIIRTPTSDPSGSSDSDSDTDSESGSTTGPFEDCLHLAAITKLYKYVLEEDNSIQEEIKIRNNDSNDLIIFRNVDSMYLDDRLLAMMPEALSRRPPPGEQVLKFAVAIIQHRLEISLSEMDMHSSKIIPWPWALSHTARTALINIVAESLLFELSRTSVTQWYRSYPASYSYWTKDAIMLIFALSSPKTPLPKPAISVFEHLLQDGTDKLGWDLLGEYISMTAEYTSSNASGWLTHRIFTCITAVLKILGTDNASFALQCIIHRGYVSSCEDVNRDSNTYVLLLEQAKSKDKSRGLAQAMPETISVLVEVAATILHTLTDDDSGSQEIITAFTQSIASLLDFVLKAIPVIETHLPDVDLKKPCIPGGIGLDMVLLGLFTNPRLVYPFLEFLSTHSDFLSTDAARTFLLDPLDNAHWMYGLSREADVSIVSSCADYFAAKKRSETPLDLLAALRLCYLVYVFPTSEEKTLSAWHNMFHSVIGCVDRVRPHREEPPCQNANRRGQSGHTDACRAARTLLHEIDLDKNDDQDVYRLGRGQLSGPGAEEDEMYSRWSKHFDASTSQVPDDMVKLLRALVCSTNTADEQGRKLWRIRRLEDMEAKAGSSVSEAGASARNAMVDGVQSSQPESKTLEPTTMGSAEVIESDCPMVPDTVKVHIASATTATTPPGTTALSIIPFPSHNSHHSDLDDMHIELPTDPASRTGPLTMVTAEPITMSSLQCHSYYPEVDVHLANPETETETDQLASVTFELATTSHPPRTTDPRVTLAERTMNLEQLTSGIYESPSQSPDVDEEAKPRQLAPDSATQSPLVQLRDGDPGDVLEDYPPASNAESATRSLVSGIAGLTTRFPADRIHRSDDDSQHGYSVNSGTETVQLASVPTTTEVPAGSQGPVFNGNAADQASQRRVDDEHDEHVATANEITAG